MTTTLFKPKLTAHILGEGNFEQRNREAEGRNGASFDRGEAAGGSAVEVHGAAFLLSGMHCAFGNASVLVRAQVISSSMLTCIAPASAAGDVSVEVSANKGTDTTHDGVVYWYVCARVCVWNE